MVLGPETGLRWLFWSGTCGYNFLLYHKSGNNLRASLAQIIYAGRVLRNDAATIQEFIQPVSDGCNGTCAGACLEPGDAISNSRPLLAPADHR